MTALDAYINSLRKYAALSREGKWDSLEAVEAKGAMDRAWCLLDEKGMKIASYLVRHVNETDIPLDARDHASPEFMHFVAYALMMLIGIPVFLYLLALVLFAAIVLSR